MQIKDFQNLMKELYLKKDKKRGVHRTALWLTEELGELMEELKKDPVHFKDPEVKAHIEEEMADIIAWLSSIANILNIDLEQALNNKYPGKCPRCSRKPCRCEKELI